jgi:hypothetical protein
MSITYTIDTRPCHRGKPVDWPAGRKISIKEAERGREVCKRLDKKGNKSATSASIKFCNASELFFDAEKRRDSLAIYKLQFLR